MSAPEVFDLPPITNGIPFFQQVGVGGWNVIPMPVTNSQNSIVITSAGKYRLIASRQGDDDFEIGEFYCFYAKPPHLTADRIAAIKSDPYAAKAIRMIFSCQKCATRFCAYAGLERVPSIEKDNNVWFSDLPERFICSCGSVNFDLQTVKENLRNSLGASLLPFDSAGMIPLYNQNALIEISRRFSILLDQNPREEMLQQFITENPILLHKFPSSRLLFKPKILNFIADFAIITTQNELILVEIEKAGTRILKKDGGEASELTHAFDQVRNWLHVVSEHRLAVLASLEIPQTQINAIKGVVIAGRDGRQNPEHLRRLKSGYNRSGVEFLTFDDLASSLVSLASNIDRV
jgi:hypothetical protein